LSIRNVLKKAEEHNKAFIKLKGGRLITRIGVRGPGFGVRDPGKDKTLDRDRVGVGG